MPPILNAQGLSKRFGAVPLFQNISFPVSDGDRIGLIGPNGAGKSTLLAILAGEQQPDSGDLATRKRARIAYVTQESSFTHGLTVRQALEAALTAAAIPEAEHEGRLRETSGRVGFASLDAEAATLSGGWRKRLAIAEAIVMHPDVLLLDEPTNPVSYTHLDVYKRQIHHRPPVARLPRHPPARSHPELPETRAPLRRPGRDLHRRGPRHARTCLLYTSRCV